ncbi:MAG: mechanosensitive ion channel domain-containing protein, partial [Pseudomonadota bacterium]
FFILANELRAFAVSLVAIAVAVVLATKELILCLSGTALRIGANAYTIGDRIEINGVRGNVIDQTFLATTILEIGPGHVTSQYSGRAVVFPNSLLLAHPLINETYMKDYIVHIMTIPLAVTDDWQAAEKILLGVADEACQPFLDKAARHMKELEGKNWMDVPSVKPRVSIQIPEPGRVNLLLRIPTPAHRTSRLEQVILRRFLLAFRGSGRI